MIRTWARPRAAGALLVVCALAASGCGGSHSAATTGSQATTSVANTTNQSTQKLVDALQPPPATVLKPGGKITVSQREQRTRGWQVSCVAKGHRVTAEFVRGQHTADVRKGQKGAREIIGGPPTKGSPSIWVEHVAAGAIVVSCR